MSQTIQLPVTTKKSETEKFIFRFFLLYFFLQVLPLDLRFFRHLLSFDWLNYQGLFYLAKYSPTFTGTDSFINWIIIALWALAGTLLWDKVYKKPLNEDRLSYGIRVLVRYRLAAGIIAYGFLKFFPLQAPLPSISNLNTAYGDFTAWKLFSLGLGVVPGYQSFLGLVEIIAGLLLLNRKTAIIATLIILPFTGNVAISNVAYEGGEYVYAFYLLALALYLFAFDALRLFKLVSLEVPAAPNTFKPVFQGKWKTYRLAAKGLFILFFVVLYGFSTYNAYQKGGYQFPEKAGFQGFEGFYNVTEFRWNGQTLPYSKTDSSRWQNVVFEKWNTISIQSTRPVFTESLPTEEIFPENEDRIYELAGSQGRHYYSYDTDSLGHSLVLQNRNSNYRNDQLRLSVHKEPDGSVILKGITSGQDSVYAVLNKTDKKYLIWEAQKAGRRGGLKL